MMAFQQKSVSTGGETVVDKLQDLFTNCWEKGTLPQDLREKTQTKRMLNVILSYLKIKTVLKIIANEC